MDLKQQELEEAKRIVEQFNWTFAKTYANTTPHEYYICKKDNPNRELFNRFFEIVEKYGVWENFYRQKWLYLYLGDGKKYFAGNAGTPDKNGYILNRCNEGNKYEA